MVEEPLMPHMSFSYPSNAMGCYLLACVASAPAQARRSIVRSSKSEDQLSGYEEVRQAAKWENEPNNDSQLYAADGDSGEELVTSSCLTLLESQMRPRVSTKLKLFPGLWSL